MKKESIAFILFLLTANCFATQNICDNKNDNFKIDFKKVSVHITAHPVVQKNFSGTKLMPNEVISTKDNEYADITYEKPFKVVFQVYPNSSITMTNQATAQCGPKIKLNHGKIISDGAHPVIPESQLNLCDYELETDETYIEPLGTTYIAETGALGDAIAELNGEPAAGSKERFSVERGVISVKLKKISKHKTKNVVKYAKNSKEKKAKKGKEVKVAKATKTKSRTRLLAQNERIKLKKGAKLKIARNKKMKKTQTAELEIYDPSGEN